MKAPSQKEMDALVARVAQAKYLERIKPFELTEDEKKGDIKHFGNNFYLLFSAIRGKSKNPKSKHFLEFYLERAEALGEPWKNFLSQNTSLLKEIDEILEKDEILFEIRSMYRDITFTLGEEEADKFDRKFHPEIGVNTFMVPYERKLNILLEKASKAMEKVGIDPKIFYS